MHAPVHRLVVERADPLGQTQTEPGPGEVKLWVSNQSFHDDPIPIRVEIDGRPIIDEEFAVEGQHNSIGFNLTGLEPGIHTITARSGTGVERTDEFTLPADAPRWLVLDYWYYPDDAEGRFFTFDEFDHPVAFA